MATGKRIESLDYLRGMMAMIVIAYHFSYWIQDHAGTQDNLEIAAVYSVAGFYTLSGITMYLVYYNRFKFKSIFPYYVRRIFRIFPLFWLATSLTWYFVSLSEDWWRVLINYTGAFGFIDPRNSINNGGWSVGNELVFYTAFPVLILLLQKSKYLLYAVFAIFASVTLYYAFYILNPNQSIADQWGTFVNPLNHIVFFIGGILIAHTIGAYRNNILAFSLLFTSLAIFLFYPVTDQQILALVDWDKIVFSLATFGIVTSFFLVRVKLPRIINWGLSKLGEISYSIYLLHFVVFFIICYTHGEMENLHITAPIAFVVTLIVSYITYHLIERPFIKLSGRLMSKYYSR